ncbi:MAG: hypothetical protein HZB26_15665 [Candidatus Hydrogenedentes bacterium]|nr:hypothetical protein [Candidatus Hydrogenedentota bacterium]
MQRSAAVGMLLTVFLSLFIARTGAADPVRFVQDRFAIGFWVDPPPGKDMDARYKEIADANFTVVIGGFGASTPETVARQLELCQKYNLRAVVAADISKPDRLAKEPACWGYALRDEPSAKDFPALRAMVDQVRAARPGKLAYINLFPTYASAEQLGTATYDEHVSRFVREVDVDVLSMDHYPAMRPNEDSRASYCDNLAVMSKYALERNIPFWNFFNTMPFGPHYDPTEAQLRWQIYTSLAYGAKGVLYFCYWTPRGEEFPKGGAILTADGARTRHYDQAKRINAAVKNLGPTLMQLTSTAVYRVKPDGDPAKALAGSPISIITPGDYLVGVFTHPDGRRAVLLNNYSYSFTAWPTIEFDCPFSRIVEVDPATGDVRFIKDDSPDTAGMQLSLDSGEGRLFLLPAK